MLKRKVIATAAAALLLTFVIPDAAVGQRDPRWGNGGVEFNAHVGLLNDEPEFDPGDTGQDLIRRDAVVGGRIYGIFHWRGFVGIEVQNSLQRLALPGETPNMQTWWITGVLGYNFQIGQNLQIYPVLGAGSARFSIEEFDPETNFALSYGAGAKYYVWSNVAVRADVRQHHVPNALKNIREEATGGPVPEADLYMNELSIGVSYFLGGPRDSDKDGVFNRGDLCPDTPAGVIVDDDGCPMDSDLDGVPDGWDQCPNTPRGATVDEYGCPWDADLDMVLNGLDKCPDTPPGALVDTEGCPFDSDNDGYLDGIDRCPDTPEGAIVDETGCSEIQEGIQEGLLVLHNVYFDFNEDTLRPESMPILDEVGLALLQRPGIKFEIQGHTDAIGSMEYNQELSDRRADTVLTYLIENYPDLDPSLYSARGVGEDRPIATNETPEGRQENRRVEFREIE
ncbi:MAG: OmpA family protein [marine benthic group bacterium]|nr:OmpA family protein [Candidatus Benthicola marisminoris]